MIVALYLHDICGQRAIMLILGQKLNVTEVAKL